MKRAARSLSLLLALALGVAPALADSDSDRAREAVRSGRIVPLSDILAKVDEMFEGDVLEVQLEDEGREAEHAGSNEVVYEIKLLTPQGNVLKLKFDARTKELVKIKGRGAEAARKGGGRQ